MTDPVLDLANVFPKINIPKNTELELEIRYNLDERKPGGSRRDKLSTVKAINVLKRIITHHLTKGSNCSIEQSINFITADNRIKQLVFIDGVQDKAQLKHYQKTKLINAIQVMGTPSYKFTLSFEKAIGVFPTRDCSGARIKLRFSIELDVWRIDITLVKPIDSLSNPHVLKSSKTKMLFSLPINQFVEKAPWVFASHVELELEYIGEHTAFVPKHITSILDDIDVFIDAGVSGSTNSYSEYQNKLFEIAEYIKPKRANMFKHKFGLKQLSNQVIEMDKNIFVNKVLPFIENYWITDKVDGKRSLIFINKTGTWAINDTATRIGEGLPSVYIFDTEYYEEHEAYYIFDVMVVAGKVNTGESFRARLQRFPDMIKATNNIDGFDLRIKPFIRLTKKFYDQIKQLDEGKKPYETDGYVFTHNDGTYDKMVTYKGKPIDKLSVDFFVKKCPQQLLGVRPYIAGNKNLYILFSGISKQVYGKLQMEVMDRYDSIFPHINKRYLPEYFPIQFQPSDFRFAYLYWGVEENLDGEVGEFVISNPNAPVANYKWKLLRTRDDRKVELARGNYFGNNYKVAEMTWLSYQNPLDFSDPDLQNTGYFQESDSTLHKQSRAFNSFVKSQIFEQHKNTQHVMDIASGKGQDLFRYASNCMSEVMFVEIDKTAIMELISRKHDYSKDDKKRGSMHIMTQQLNLNQPFNDNIAKLSNSSLPIPPSGFDLIVCNFALHYLIGTKNAIVNIGKFINTYLKPGGRFIFTAFDGQDIVDLLEESGDWKSYTPGKFHIKRSYTGNTLQLAGQKIEVLLPFSKNTYYTEYLVNIEYIETLFAKFNLTLETDQSFSEFIPSYKSSNKMDNDDKLYTGLYHYYSFYKTKK
jgi:ubiquinone/menaquinone biosynthesis C-methylase UbiE